MLLVAPISNVINRRADIEKELKSNNSPLRKTKYDLIDSGLNSFISNANNRGVMISDICLSVKAKELADEYGFDLFKSSPGYLANFKKRNCIMFEKSHGVANSISRLVIDDLNTKLRDLLLNVDPKDVFNVDEFGLFWCLQP